MKQNKLIVLSIICLICKLFGAGNLYFSKSSYYINLVVEHGKPHGLCAIDYGIVDSTKIFLKISDLDSLYFDYAKHRIYIEYSADSTINSAFIFDVNDSSAFFKIDSVYLEGKFEWAL